MKINNTIEPVDITVPGSKSITVRVLIIATFLKQPLLIKNYASCDDSLTLISALKEIGYEITFPAEKELLIAPPIVPNLKPEITINGSAAALRFLLMRLAGWQKMESVITICEQLQQRPMANYLSFIKKLGAEVTINNNIITIKGKSLSYNIAMLRQLKKNISSQYVSALLLSSPLFKEKISISNISSWVSSSYIRLTLAVREQFGLKDESNDYAPLASYTVEPDISSACYFWALGALSNVAVKINCKKSLQPDYDFLKVLEEYGALLEITEDSVLVSSGKRKGITVNMNNMPDQVPTMVIMALLAQERTVIQDIAHLRYKESNRIKLLINELSKIGAKIETDGNDLFIDPLKKSEFRQNNLLNTANDHRLVMSFAMLSLFYPLKLSNVNSVSKSFPLFFRELQKISRRMNA